MARSDTGVENKPQSRRIHPLTNAPRSHYNASATASEPRWPAVYACQLEDQHEWEVAARAAMLVDH